MTNDFLEFIQNKKLTFESGLKITIEGETSELQLELEEYGVSSTPAHNGVRIDFKNDEFYLFKDYSTALNKNSQSDGPLSTDVCNIIIFNKTKVYKTNSLVRNFKLFKEIIAYFESYKISEYKDNLNKKLILLSSSLGRLDLSYNSNNYEYMFFEQDFSDFHKLIKKHKADEKACSILRDNIISLFSKNPNMKENFFEIFHHVKNIIRNFNRDFELYNSKFSFASLKTELEDEKKEFLQDYAKFYADFMPKLYGIPLQVGAYVLIIGQVIKIGSPLLTALFCLMVGMVGLYSNRLICISDELLKDSITDFNEKVQRVKEKTQDNFDDSVNLSEKTVKFSNNIKFFKFLNIITHLLFVCIGLYLFGLEIQSVVD